MTGGSGRRAALQRLGFAALLPFSAFGLPLAGARGAGRRVAAPAGSFTLERVLTRELAGGAAIVVTRRWRIAFARAKLGLTVNGEQVFADVAAPSALASLATLERSRSASGIFPLALDEAGQIRGDARSLERATLMRALDTGRALVQAMPIAVADKQDARGFITQLAALGAEAVSQLPRDLFFPHTGKDTVNRELALPDGGTGSIAVTATVSAAPDTGLLRVSERRIVTRIDSSEREATERWTLAQV